MNAENIKASLESLKGFWYIITVLFFVGDPVAHWNQRNILENQIALVANKVYYSFWEEYKQNSALSSLLLFSFFPETEVHLNCKYIYDLVPRDFWGLVWKSKDKRAQLINGRLWDIFYNVFHCAQLIYTTNINFQLCLKIFGSKIQILQW